MLALLSPPGATHDEWYHAANIWCARGEKPPSCYGVLGPDPISGGPRAVVNLDAVNCQRLAAEPLFCPTGRSEPVMTAVGANGGVGIGFWSGFVSQNGVYPHLFYYIMNLFVVSSAELSFALVRIGNALIVSALLGLTMWLLPSRHRVVLNLVMLTTFSGTGYFLFSSVNPSSWTSAGLGVGWLSIHAAVFPSSLGNRRRFTLAAIGSIAWMMAVGSRYDAYPFLAVAIGLTCLHVLWSRYPTRRKWIFVGIPIALLALLVFLQKFSPFPPIENIRVLFEFKDGQPDNTVFVSGSILEGLPNALLALGTVPTMSQVVVPQAVYITSLSLLAFLMIRTFEKRSRLQTVGFALISAVISLAIATQVAGVDNRDSGFIEPRYVYPLLIFGVGWWFLLGPEDLLGRVSKHLRSAGIATSASFFLTVFTIAERFVDRQKFGLRYLPEGPDQWWWTWLPVGPNVLVVLAPWCLWMCFRQVVHSEPQPTDNLARL
jgi:hypothetical protein